MANSDDKKVNVKGIKTFFEGIFWGKPTQPQSKAQSFVDDRSWRKRDDIEQKQTQPKPKARMPCDDRPQRWTDNPEQMPTHPMPKARIPCDDRQRIWTDNPELKPTQSKLRAQYSDDDRQWRRTDDPEQKPTQPKLRVQYSDDDRQWRRMDNPEQKSTQPKPRAQYPDDDRQWRRLDNQEQKPTQPKPGVQYHDDDRLWRRTDNQENRKKTKSKPKAQIPDDDWPRKKSEYMEQEPTQPKPKVKIPGDDRSRRWTNNPEREGALFKEPAQFIFTDDKTGKLRYDERTMQLLTEIKQSLNVVAITGLSGTGKSYLLNRLVGKREGFETGDRIHACTKGIWVWCCHHPTQDDQVLLLLDVQGFGDFGKVNRNEDAWLFTLATILSSTLIYNNMGALDAYALDRLNFLEQIDSTIQVSHHEEDKRLFDFDFFFPSFVVTLRDFDLDMVDRFDQPITPDEYLEELLVQKKGQGDIVEKYNTIRLLIRRYFKKRKAFVFISPCGPREKLDNLPDCKIEPDFLESMEEFSDYVFERRPLQMKSGLEINGRMFANLAMHYVNAIGQNKQPSILEATEHMIHTENQAAVAAASDIYKIEMEQCIANMGESVPQDEVLLVDFHELCLSKALEVLEKMTVFDDEEILQRKTKSACKGVLSQLKCICDANSTKACQEAIGKLNKRVEKKMKEGTYNCMSGYVEYTQDINWIVRSYTGMTGLGSQSKQILQEYLDGKEDEDEKVKQMTANAQKGRTDSDKSSPIKEQRRSMKVDDHPCRHMLKIKVDKMESDMSHVLEKQHVQERNTIQEKYIDFLNLKIEELQRQRSEQLQDTHAMKEIEGQLADLNKVYEYAKNLYESGKETTPDNDETEELSASDNDDDTDELSASDNDETEELPVLDNGGTKYTWPW